VEHTGNDDSKMHPIFRKTQPLISDFDISKKIFTIVIPTYKNTLYLQECLDSVLLSVKNLDCEIIVGIDGCKETLNYIKTKKFDNRIRFYFFEKNVGPYIIKNSLCSISNSEIILFFDSDDIMNENMVADMLELHKTKDIV
jgi:glycosyltransferase involved in cell wall biosynthesis